MARHIHMTAVSGDLTGTKAGSGEDAGARGASVSAVLDAFDRAEGLLIDVLGQTDRATGRAGGTPLGGKRSWTTRPACTRACSARGRGLSSAAEGDGHPRLSASRCRL
jgi:hypothetical protein